MVIIDIIRAWRYNGLFAKWENSMKSLLKKGLAVLLVSSLTLNAHADIKMSHEEKQAFEFCSVLSYLGYHAMGNYQDGKTKAQNRALLMKKFATDGDKNSQTFYGKIIDDTLQEVYTLPKGSNAEETEEYKMTLAFGMLSGCAEELKLDLSKMEHADWVN